MSKNIRWDAKTAKKILKTTRVYFDFPKKLNPKNLTKWQKEKLRKAWLTSNWINAAKAKGEKVLNLKASGVSKGIFEGQVTDRGRFYVKLPNPAQGVKFSVKTEKSGIILKSEKETRKFIEINTFLLLSDTVGYLKQLIKENRTFTNFSFLVNGFASDKFHSFNLESFLYILNQYNAGVSKFFSGIVLFKKNKPKCSKPKTKTFTNKKPAAKTAKSGKSLKRVSLSITRAKNTLKKPLKSAKYARKNNFPF